jgi:hypothetical protein
VAVEAEEAEEAEEEATEEEEEEEEEVSVEAEGRRAAYSRPGCTVECGSE